MAAEGFLSSRWPSPRYIRSRLTWLRPLLITALLMLLTTTTARAADAGATRDVLLKFRSGITDPRGALKGWGAEGSGPPCNGRYSKWTGVFCGPDGNVIKLVLEGMSLSGPLELAPLADLPVLRSLSFMNNAFQGGFPTAVTGFVSLRRLYLSGNAMAGRIPDDAFSHLAVINRVHLARNNFEGPIPLSLTKATRLAELQLEENNFVGGIPEFRQPGIKVNVSGNALEGPIPDSLSKLDPTAFSGNRGLCGPPLGDCSSEEDALPQDEGQAIKTANPNPGLQKPDVNAANQSSLMSVTFITVVAILALLAALIVSLHQRHREDKVNLGRPPSIKPRKITSIKRDGAGHHYSNSQERLVASGVPAGTASSVSGGSTTGKIKSGEQGRLVFVREGSPRTFELQDMLRASAEVMGNGTFGSSYKAAMQNGVTVVVKRFKEMNAIGREDFTEHMRRLGRLEHPNLLPLVAYYYRKEEKLLVFEHVPNGSLAHVLHGGSPQQMGGLTKIKLDWPARLKIVKGMSRALAYLHTELPMLNLPHGHLKSSNVLLTDSVEPQFTDYALAPVVNRTHATQTMVAFRAPEIAQHGRITKKADVWSLGIVILELLTGKLPAGNAAEGTDGTDLTEWINSIAGEDAPEVFDKEMGRQVEADMGKLLKIAMACCEGDMNKRPDMEEALEKIEELRDGEVTADLFSSCASDLNFVP